MKTLHQTRIGTAILAALAFIAPSEPGWAAPAQHQIVAVEVRTAGVPDVLHPGREHLSTMRSQLEEKAVNAFGDAYPFFTWVASSGPNAAGAKAILIIEFKMEGNFLPEIGFAVSYRAGDSPPVELNAIECPALFKDGGEPIPDQGEIIPKTVARAEACFKTMAGRESWMLFIRNVPLAEDLQQTPAGGDFLILPLMADKLNASDESIIDVEFKTGQSQQTGKFKLHPFDAAIHPGVEGWQQCTVGKFVFGGHEFTGWVAQIAAAIAERIPKTVSVRLVHFVSNPHSSSGISRSP